MGDPAPPTGGDLAPLLEEIRRLKKRVGDLESPSGTQRGQVLRDLVGRIGYSADGTGTSASWTANAATPFVWGPLLTFELAEPRTVSIQTALRGNAEGTAVAATTNVTTAGRGAIFVDGVMAGGARGEVGVSIPSVAGSTFRYDYAISSLICRSLITLPAGVHKVQGGFEFISAVAFGGGGSAKFTASDPNIFVDVLQTAA